MGIFVLKPFVVGKLSMFSERQNDALMHREDLKGGVTALESVFLCTNFRRHLIGNIGGHLV